MKKITVTKINSFSGEFGFLSNFAESPIEWTSPELGSSVSWPTVEHLFQAMKSEIVSERKGILEATTPGRAKRLGRKVTLRKDWEEVKDEMMMQCLRLKFWQNPALMKKLIATGNAVLIEGNNWHDNFWGDCSCEKCVGIKGENWLGRLLMIVRTDNR